MLKIKLIALAVLIAFSSISCTKVLYTTGQVLDRYKTKDDLISAFGLPSQKRQEGYVQEWLYDYGSVGIKGSFSTANANASASAYGNTVYGQASGNSSTVTTFTNVQRYLKFTMDGRDRVTKYEWQGVDLTERKSQPGKTIALVLVGLAALVVVIVAASSGSGGGD